MEQAEMFKRNASVQDLFSLVGQCIKHCGTINRPTLTFEDQRCLQNCGYNKTFLTTKLRDLVESTTWSEQEKSPFQ